MTVSTEKCDHCGAVPPDQASQDEMRYIALPGRQELWCVECVAKLKEEKK